MGLLVSFLKGKEPADVFIDFENARPSDQEVEIFTQVQEVLSRAPEIMNRLNGYSGCQELARKAMSTPTLENEQEAFEGLLVAVDHIHSFFTFARELERVTPALLKKLAGDSVESSKQTLSDQQALAKQLADIFDFALRFDQLRMTRPSISNDFSYYRRLLPKFNKHPHLKVRDDEASGMALFTAEHIPMTSCLAKAASSALEENNNVTQALAVMANSCQKMVKGKKFHRPDTNLFCARAMTGAIVLFDHVDPLGAFHKKSPINMKPCILLLKRDFPKEVGLLNALHYSTKHFKDAPQSTQHLFED